MAAASSATARSSAGAPAGAPRAASEARSLKGTDTRSQLRDPIHSSDSSDSGGHKPGVQEPAERRRSAGWRLCRAPRLTGCLTGLPPWRRPVRSPIGGGPGAGGPGDGRPQRAGRWKEDVGSVLTSAPVAHSCAPRTHHAVPLLRRRGRPGLAAGGDEHAQPAGARGVSQHSSCLPTPPPQLILTHTHAVVRPRACAGGPGAGPPGGRAGAGPGEVCQAGGWWGERAGRPGGGVGAALHTGQRR